MPYAIQYSQDSGSTFSQDSITTADITTDGIISNIFTCIKDSTDNIYVVCQKSGAFAPLPIIKIDKTGNKIVSRSSSFTWLYRAYVPCTITLSRDEKYLLLCGDDGSGQLLFSV